MTGPVGLRYATAPDGLHSRAGCRHVGVPFWLLFAGLARWPALAFVRGPLRRWRRRKRGQCLHCGYNLAGLPERRCPECGTAFRAVGGSGAPAPPCA